VEVRCYLSLELQQQKLKQDKMAEKQEAEEKIAQLQLLEQNMQNFLMQKQQFQMQLSEVDSALENLKDSNKSYKIVANIMVDANKEELEKELKKKKEMLELRLKSLEKQEENIREKSQKLQKEVLGSMEENGRDK
jgi:prefoldin beta subunit|tara:strand:+ start:792 stop:1196 length:405 start_codon:yes stop_codon:yes gene_type:complete